MHLGVIDLFKLELVIYLMSIPILMFGFIIYEMIKESFRKKNPSE